MSEPPRAPRREFWKLDFKRSQLVLGPKTWAAGVLGLLSVVLYVITSPSNPVSGLLIGLAGVIGVVLGVLLQPTPKPVPPPDYSTQAAAAVRGLADIADAIADAQVLAASAADGSPLQRGLVLSNVQADLDSVRVGLYRSMGEWDLVSPGAVDAAVHFREAGSVALNRLSKLETEKRDGDVEL